MKDAIRKALDDLRAVIAYELFKLATRIYPALQAELIEMMCLAIIEHDEGEA